MTADLRPQHKDALAGATAFVARLTPADLDRPSGCAGWSQADLLAHMIGQHLGFAAALRDGDAAPAAYDPVPFTRAAWDDSVTQLSQAFAARSLDDRVLEVELNRTTPLPVSALLAAQFLDTVVHTWDLAQGFGEFFEPPADHAEIVLGVAENIQDGAYGDGPNTPFAPRLPAAGDTWSRALALVGRDPAAGRG